MPRIKKIDEANLNTPETPLRGITQCHIQPVAASPSIPFDPINDIAYYHTNDYALTSFYVNNVL